uniref:Ig-like domain-containing protein n=1 Tax=Clostridium sp. UBA1056 TaxID=1946346 RepID=UPI0032164767
MRFKKWTSLIVLFTFLMSTININVALAVDSQTTNSKVVEPEIVTIQETNEEYVNPMYEGLDVEIPSEINDYADPAVISDEVQPFTSVEEAGKYVRHQMVKRVNQIKIDLKMNYYSNLASDISNIALSYDDSYASNEADYLKANFSGWKCSVQNNTSTGIITLTYSMTYLSTYAQEQQVDKEIKNVLDELNVYNSDEYTKIKAVHDYIVKNVKYDHSLKRFSTYNGIVEKNVVCQGFASLTYRMLKELGIGVRYISGTGNGGRHGWNIVRIGNEWYNVDNTWDENTSTPDRISYTYLLKNERDFTGHSRNAEFKTNEFNKLYPMAKSSYGDPSVLVSSINLNMDKLTLPIGTSKDIVATVLPSNAGSTTLDWKSSDEKIAKVNGNGKVTSIGAGTAIITCTSNDGSKITASVEITVPQIKLASIKLNLTKLSLNVGAGKELIATVAPANATMKDVVWASSNEAIAKVDEKGNVVAVGEGITNITATAKDGSGKLATCTVTVTDPSKIKIASIKLSATSANLNLNDTKELTATIAPANATMKDVVWA